MGKSQWKTNVKVFKVVNNESVDKLAWMCINAIKIRKTAILMLINLLIVWMNAAVFLERRVACMKSIYAVRVSPFCIALLFMLLWMEPGDVYAQQPDADPSETEEHHAVLVLVPGLSMDEFFQLMSKERLQHGAAVAGLNRVTADAASPLNELLTLSSGARAKSGLSSMSGWEEKEESTYVQSSFSKIRKENKETSYGASPGILGEKLKEAGGTARFAGHSDYVDKQHSYAPFFTVNYKGEARGSRDGVVDKNRTAPGGWLMNVEKTLAWVDKVQHQSPLSWSVIEWGDVYRSHQEGDLFSSPKQLQPLQHLLIELKKREGTLYLMGVDPSKENMIPFVEWGHGGSGSMKRLNSATTGQPYLGSSIDAAPTFLRTFQLSLPASWYGSELTPDEDALLQDVEAEIEGVSVVHTSRAAVLSTYISILILLLAAGFLYGKFHSAEPPRLINLAVLTGMASPFAFTLLPAVIGRPEMPVAVYAALITAAALGTGGAALMFGRERAAVIISLLLITLLSADLMNGAYAIQRSYLGYDPLIGARYGGIGNELGGFFAAASIVSLEPLLRYKKTAALPMILCFIIITGSSALGKNAGITIGSGLMFGSLWMEDLRRAGWKRSLPAGAAGASALVGALWLLQYTGGPSHIGAAFQQLFLGEWKEIENMITRKIEMNIKIMFHSNWTKLLITSYALASFYLLMEKKNTMRPSQQIVLKVGTAGSIFLLLLNDSGAVAASTSMFYLLCVRYIWNGGVHG